MTTEPTPPATDAEPAWSEFRPHSVHDFVDLARYVSPDNVARLGLRSPDAHRRRLTDRTAGNHATVEDLYRRVRTSAYSYTDEPWRIDQRAQRIRDPEELDSYAGTCVDFAVMFASLCLEAKIAPLVAVGWNTTDAPRGIGHVWLILDLERDPDELAARGDAVLERAAFEPGSALLHGAALAPKVRMSSRYVVIDPTVAQSGDDVETSTFDRACGVGAECLQRFDHVVVVDVAVAHAQGFVPYVRLPEEQRPVIGRLLPSTPNYRDFGEERADALAAIDAAAGLVVVHGDSGLGKSMLALRAAADADGGFGWFLNASSESAIVKALGLAEAHQVGDRTDETNLEDLRNFARNAMRRLDDSRVPWVVVVDNANRAPGAIRGWLPTPDAAVGQRVIVTTTNAEWLSLADTEVELRPLPRDVIDFPGALRVAGRPLFVEAFTRMADATGQTLDDLAALAHDVDGDAGDVLWHLALGLARSGALSADALVAAETAAWCSPDSLEHEAVAAASNTSLDALEVACDIGLAERTEPGVARMHRLVGAAIRDASLRESADGTLSRVRAVLASETLLDAEALDVIRAALAPDGPLTLAITDGDAEVGRAELGRTLHDLAFRVEPIVGVGGSDPVFQRALDHLDERDVRRRAACLHSSGREAFQFHKKDIDRTTRALSEVELCLELRLAALAAAPDDVLLEVEYQRTEALKGLLEVQLGMAQLSVARAADDQAAVDAALDLALRGSNRIDSALERRSYLLGGDPNHPDILRGKFNQAFAAVNMAQQVDSEVERDKWLSTALERYGEVRSGRESFRSKPLAHIASCDAGMALVQYLRAVLSEDLTVDARVAHLRDAATALARALEQRELIEAPIDDKEVQKTTRLETKIALARYMYVFALTTANPDDLEPTQSKEVSGLLGEIEREIAGFARVLSARQSGASSP